MKWIKWFAGIVVVLAVVVVGALSVIDLNSYKPQITTKVKEVTGRELTIDGDIGWSFYPYIGLQLEGVSLSNLPGEQLPPMLSINQASVGVAFMPLLTGKVEVENVSVDGVKVEMVTLKDGRTSLTGIGGEETKDTSANETDSSGTALKRWALGRLAVNQLTLRSRNLQTDTEQELNVDELTLERIEPERAAPLYVKLRLGDGDLSVETEANAMLTVAADFSRIQIDGWRQKLLAKGEVLGKEPVKLDLNFDADLDLAAQKIGITALAATLNDFKLEGQALADMSLARPKLTLKARGGDLNLDPWLPEPTEDTEPEDAPPSGEPQPEQEPDLSAMSAADADIDISLASLRARGADLTDVVLKVVLNNGVLDLNQFSANAFEGKMNATAQLNSQTSPASYRFDKKIDDVQIQPLLKAFADTDLLAGSGTVSFAGSGKGLTPTGIMKGLNGKGRVALNDGAVYGVNVAKIIRDNLAKLKGDFSAESQEEKTDFSSFSSNLNMSKGVLRTTEITLASPLLRADGNGQVDVLPQVVDYEMTVALVGSLEGQGGKSADELKDVPIPLTVKGPVTDLKYGVDTDALLKGKLDQKVDEEKKKLEEKLKDKLKSGLLKGLGG